jgi:alkanesulfonate monooxygenase SsuD/methylene tetrahydromethanopterin reductase-like flavin-dependent oxidoreductase (luciferase family)
MGIPDAPRRAIWLLLALSAGAPELPQRGPGGVAGGMSLGSARRLSSLAQSHHEDSSAEKEVDRMTVKVVIQMYPMLPAADEAARSAQRPIARNRDLYHEVIHDMTDVVKAADDLGYWGFTTVEHHFHSEGYEVGPNPGVLNAYWASQVKNLRVGQLGYVMSAQHPLRVAEETAINDHLSNGKYFVGFARGYQSRWTEIIGQHYGTRAALPPVEGQDSAAALERAEDDAANRRLFEDNVDLVVKAWTQDLVQHQSPTWEVPYPYEIGGRNYPAIDTAAKFGSPGEVGKDNQVAGVATVPAPYQEPHPPVFIASSVSPETVSFAAKRQFNVGYFAPMDVLDERAHQYMRDSEAAGFPATLGGKQMNIRWVHFDHAGMGFDDQLRAWDLDIYKNFYAKFFPDAFSAMTTDAAWIEAIKKSGLYYGGTPENVAQGLKAEWERVPCEYLTLIWHYAQQPKEDTIREMEIFMRDVYPAIKDMYPGD